jgi:cell division protein FtsW
MKIRDWSLAFLLLAVGLLLSIGLVVLFSISQSTDGGIIFKKQLFWLCVALVLGFIMSRVDLQIFRQPPVVLVLLGLSLLGLILVLVPGIGIRVNGAQRWLGAAGIRLQVSEFVKVALVLLLSHYIALHQRGIKSFWQGFIFPSMAIGFICGLILLQPDFGTAFLCGLVGVLLLFLAGASLTYLVPSFLAAASLFMVAIAYDPVRLKRITSFLDVEAHKMDGAYQLWQGMLAFAAGGLQGVGLGKGRQQLSFLPEAHTDFIFPIIGEELGFIFSAIVVGLFSVIFWIGVRQLKRAPNLYQFTLVAGCMLFIALQALINMGVVTGCLPTKGMSLPFISYGGSNLVVMGLLIGIWINAVRSWQRVGLNGPSEL